MDTYIHPGPIRMIHEVIDLEGLPIEFNEDLILRRGTEKEVEYFRQTILSSLSYPNVFPISKVNGKEEVPIYEVYYEGPIKKDGLTTYKPKKLKPEQFRYWVFQDTLPDYEEGFDLLSIALKLFPFKLTLSIGVDLELNGSRWDPRELFQSHIVREEIMFGRVKRYTKEDFDELPMIVEGLQNIYLNYESLKFPFQIYSNSFSLPPLSGSKLLNLFSALEALITHKPVDTGDSIIKQLARKINLLNNRFKDPISRKMLPNEMRLDSFIKELYKVRSSNAHGTSYQFGPIFSDIHLATSYVEFLLVECLKHALVEPQLINDLRAC